MIQESLRDPWRQLVAPVLLNRTTGRVARPVFFEILRRWPTPGDLSRVRLRDLTRVLRPLGFQNRRARILRRLARAYDAGGWTDPSELPGIGPYARASWAIFVEGRLDVETDDVRLREYLDYVERTGDDVAVGAGGPPP